MRTARSKAKSEAWKASNATALSRRSVHLRQKVLRDQHGRAVKQRLALHSLKTAVRTHITKYDHMRLGQKVAAAHGEQRAAIGQGSGFEMQVCRG